MHEDIFESHSMFPGDLDISLCSCELLCLVVDAALGLVSTTVSILAGCACELLLQASLS